MENFRIESLEINKIGAFEHIKMDFPKKIDPNKAEIHILTGENGTGKSTILEALVNIGLDIPDDTKLKIFNKNTGLLEEGFINIETSDNYFYKLWKIKEVHGNPIPQELIDLMRFDKPLSLGMFAYSGYRRTQDVLITSIQEIKTSPLKDSLHFDKSIDSENLLQWIFNKDYQMLVAFRDNEMAKGKILFNTIKNIEQIITEIIGEEVQFILKTSPFKTNIYFKNNDSEVPFENLPDGLKSMISWLGDLLMRMDRIKWKDDLPIFDRNFILFLDEIEVHLHPAWQRKILPVVQKLFKNAQIFISTHSPFVVGSVDGAWIHKLKKDGAYAVLDGEPVLSEDGKSVRRILDETFGINQQYGVEVEKDLEKFREIRQKIMQGHEYNLDEFNKLVKHLASQSTELEQMMGMEMNQLKRITQKELV